MDLIEKLEDIEKPFTSGVVTIGNFDGVHLGHLSLFQTVIKKARETGGVSIAITFEPHPARVLRENNHPPLITRYPQKKSLIRKAGIDVMICIPFTKEFAALTAREFVEDILVKKIGMKAIVVGEDYAFGKNREGDVGFLNKLAPEFGFEVMESEWIDVADSGEVVPARGVNKGSTQGRISSTGIRELVMDGRVFEAKKLLGRHYQIKGVVEKGRGRGGKLLGFPTANIALTDELCPSKGVYAVTVLFNKELYKGVANIGCSPTFGDNVFTVEVHIFDFNETIYEKSIRVNFIKRIRSEKKFSGIEELSEQIKNDANAARELLSGF